ncbi:hypothetical protein ACH42_07080 [Endozoicomonas sp. (ex Bugula neritina AB1)]|nr:hypothetical protein ACH42_07080 [Endozoicomonas sp. (ex Bugula neritina AB1)]
MAVAVAIFLMTADVTDINSSEHQTLSQDDGLNDPAPLPSVHAHQFKQQLTDKVLTLYGRTQADRVITISAEIPARVVAVHSQRGESLKPGQEIVRLREGSLQAQLKYAKAQLKQAQQEYKSALSLFKKNHIAENTLTLREVEVAQAESSLEQLQIQWDNTRIKAPVAGILNQRHVELGDFIDTGKPVAEILDLDPLVISIDVPQSEISAFAVNDKAQVRFITGETSEATIRYIDRQANAATRTFSVELTVPNADMAIPAGLSVEADLFMDKVSAIAVSPALLALDAGGQPGLKWVDQNSVVQFSPVKIVKNTSNQLWLSGIPIDAKVITRGQGFVRIGDQVDVATANVSATEIVAGD